MFEQSNSRTLVINNQDFINFDENVAQVVFENYYKYEPILNEAFTQFMREIEK